MKWKINLRKKKLKPWIKQRLFLRCVSIFVANLKFLSQNNSCHKQGAINHFRIWESANNYIYKYIFCLFGFHGLLTFLLLSHFWNCWITPPPFFDPWERVRDSDLIGLSDGNEMDIRCWMDIRCSELTIMFVYYRLLLFIVKINRPIFSLIYTWKIICLWFSEKSCLLMLDDM